MLFNKHTITVILLVMVNLMSQAHAAGDIDIETDIAAIREMSVISGSGDGGRPGPISDSINAFRRLVKAKDAKEIFSNLLNEANPEGQLYALCGLFFTDKDAFQSALVTYENSAQKLYRQEGCSTFTGTVGELIHSQRGGVILVNAGESTNRWFSEHPEYRQGGFATDIAGGGFCHNINGTLWPAK
jgi:hypothetical protein